MFNRLSEAGLKLKPAKCKLARREVEFLGYVVSAEGIMADERKVRAVTEFPTPTDLRSLRAFLGLLSYYRRFVPKFSSIAQPLYNLTRKDVPFVWGSECDTAVKQLKSPLTQAPIPSSGGTSILKLMLREWVWELYSRRGRMMTLSAQLRFQVAPFSRMRETTVSRS